jgi:RNA polymerase sigma factor (sigma-70 family)
LGERQRPGPDSALRERLIAGDETALTRTYDLHAAMVYALVARVTRDWAAAEDVTQEVFVYLWEHPAAFDAGRGSLRTWLATLAHRRAVDWVRREMARRERDERQAECLLPEPDIAGVAIAATFADRVRAAVAALPAAQQATIRLAYFEGLSYREVATKLGIPEGTAKSRMRLGLARLADRLAAEGISR